ncbi:hypothetical protein JMJ77_0014041, partial [Colletotrichum scovillei]
ESESHSLSIGNIFQASTVLEVLTQASKQGVETGAGRDLSACQKRKHRASSPQYPNVHGTNAQ